MRCWPSVHGLTSSTETENPTLVYRNQNVNRMEPIGDEACKFFVKFFRDPLTLAKEPRNVARRIAVVPKKENFPWHIKGNVRV